MPLKCLLFGNKDEETLTKTRAHFSVSDFDIKKRNILLLIQGLNKACDFKNIMLCWYRKLYYLSNGNACASLERLSVIRLFSYLSHLSIFSDISYTASNYKISRILCSEVVLWLLYCTLQYLALAAYRKWYSRVKVVYSGVSWESENSVSLLVCFELSTWFMRSRVEIVRISGWDNIILTKNLLFFLKK